MSDEVVACEAPADEASKPVEAHDTDVKKVVSTKIKLNADPTKSAKRKDRFSDDTNTLKKDGALGNGSTHKQIKYSTESDAVKAAKRKERFGGPSKPDNDGEAKKLNRVRRFSSTTLKSSEIEEKKLARATRFAGSSGPVDVEKRKARNARFGSDESTTVSPFNIVEENNP